MTKEEYIKSISSDDWHDRIREMAMNDPGRLLDVGNVMSEAMEEFNNDVYDWFVMEGLNRGMIDEDEE